LAIRVLLLPLLDAFYDLATILQVFPEGNIAVINKHLVVGAMQFTAELYKRELVIVLAVVTV